MAAVQTLKQAIDAKAAIVDQAKAADDEILAARKRLTIACSCGKRHKMGDLTLVRTHWYVSPSGCTEGDYYREGEWNFVCPKLGHRERLLFSHKDLDWRDTGNMKYDAEEAFKHYYFNAFGRTIQTHGDEEKNKISPHTKNNYTISENLRYYRIQVEASNRR